MEQIALIYTLRPAVHMFGDIAAAYNAQGLVSPESLKDAWEQFKRIEEHAQLQLDLGLWQPEFSLSEAIMGPPERFSVLDDGRENRYEMSGL